MIVTQHLAGIQGVTSDLTHLTGAGPSLQCALLLFVASPSSFIGASLLHASI
jgi:hypothetical protein